MSNLSIQERDGILVVDSRLIAQDLGIAHKNLLETLDNYRKRIEIAFGVVRFETEKPLKNSKGGRPERVAYLTEDQATLLMTFSRNTPKVVDCKVALVQAFSKAKQVIKEVIPTQVQEIERLKVELELARARDSAARSEDAAARSQQQLMAVSQAIATMHGQGMVALILGKPDAVIERITEVEKTVVCNEFGQPLRTFRGLSKTKLAKRFGMKKPQEFVNWLESVGKTELLQSGMTTTPCQYVPF